MFSVVAVTSYLVFFWSLFSAFGLNRERDSESLRIQSEYGKIRTRKIQNTETFHAVCVQLVTFLFFFCSVSVNFILVFQGILLFSQLIYCFYVFRFFYVFFIYFFFNISELVLPFLLFLFILF